MLIESIGLGRSRYNRSAGLVVAAALPVANHRSEGSLL